MICVDFFVFGFEMCIWLLTTKITNDRLFAVEDLVMNNHKQGNNYVIQKRKSKY